MSKLDWLCEVREGRAGRRVRARPVILADGGRGAGRPRLEDAGGTLSATRPWEKLGMSRRTWERRQRERRDGQG